jgi:hypothetical protein
VINGEGGGNLAIDNNLKYCAGLIFRPAKNFVIRLYDDIMKNKGVIQNESLLFAGLRNERLFIGGECNYKTNVDTVSGHNSYGISATGGVNISEKLLLFSRYDFASSLQPDMYSDNWNYKKDYQFIIAGVQYTFAKSLRVSQNGFIFAYDLSEPWVQDLISRETESR